MSLRTALSGTVSAIEAILRAKPEPDRLTLWPRHPVGRIVVALVSTALGIGLTGGTIAIYVFVYHAGADLAWALGLLQCLPLAIAPRWPIAAWRLVVAGIAWGAISSETGGQFMPWPVTSIIAVVIVMFAVSAESNRPKPEGAGLLCMAALVALPIMTGHVVPWFGLVLSGIIWLAVAFGDAVGGRHVAELGLALQKERYRAELARHAVLAERSRIARELHDVVAHHMSVIALQAEAAPYKMPGLPEEARATFALLRDEARTALGETRRVVGLLRAGDETAERTPQPGVARLADLAEAHGGLSVTLEVTGTERPLPEAVDLSAYRIVQEAVSNAARYAPGSTVAVTVRYTDAELLVDVRDDGARSTPLPGNGGHGIVGMRERAAMLGGALTAGPDGEGWAVRAVLPYDGDHDRGGDR